MGWFLNQERSLFEKVCNAETLSGVTESLEVGLSSPGELPVPPQFRRPAGNHQRGVSPAPGGFGAHGAAPGSPVSRGLVPRHHLASLVFAACFGTGCRGGGGRSGPRAPGRRNSGPRGLASVAGRLGIAHVALGPQRSVCPSFCQTDPDFCFFNLLQNQLVFSLKVGVLF